MYVPVLIIPQHEQKMLFIPLLGEYPVIRTDNGLQFIEHAFETVTNDALFYHQRRIS